MTTPFRETRMLLLRRGLFACALLLLCASAFFFVLKRDVETSAKTGIDAEIGRIAGSNTSLHNSSRVTLSPDLRLILTDPVFDLGGDKKPLTLSRMEATLRPGSLLAEQVDVSSLQLHRPHLLFDDLDLSAFLDTRSGETADLAPPADIEIIDGVLEVAELVRLSDLNMSIMHDSLSAGLLVQSDFVVGSRRAVVELQLDDPRQAFSDVGSDGWFTIQFDEAQHLDAVKAQADMERSMIASLRQVLDSIAGFWHRPLTIDGRFAITPDAIRISDASFSRNGITLSGDLDLRTRSDQSILPQLLALYQSADAALLQFIDPIGSDRWADAPIDLSWINDLDVNVRLAGRDITIGGALIDAVSLSLAGRDEGLSLEVSTDSETLGQFSARTAATETGEVELSASLSDASVAMLTLPFARRMQARLLGSPQLPEGLLAADLKLSGRGQNLGAFSDSLSGSVTASLRDGSLSGGDVIATLQTLANGRQFMTKEKGPLIPAAGRTYFDVIHGQVGINAGTARISQLSIVGDRLQIGMLGEVGLRSGQVFANGNAQLSAAEETEAEQASRNVDLPFGIGGTVFSPMIAAGVPQFEVVARAPAAQSDPKTSIWE